MALCIGFIYSNPALASQKYPDYYPDACKFTQQHQSNPEFAKKGPGRPDRQYFGQVVPRLKNIVQYYKVTVGRDGRLYGYVNEPIGQDNDGRRIYKIYTSHRVLYSSPSIRNTSFFGINSNMSEVIVLHKNGDMYVTQVSRQAYDEVNDVIYTNLDQSCFSTKQNRQDLLEDIKLDMKLGNIIDLDVVDHYDLGHGKGGKRVYEHPEILFSGRVEIKDGVIKKLANKSGNFRTLNKSFNTLIMHLKNSGYNLEQYGEQIEYQFWPNGAKKEKIALLNTPFLKRTKNNGLDEPSTQIDVDRSKKIIISYSCPNYSDLVIKGINFDLVSINKRGDLVVDKESKAYEDQTLLTTHCRNYFNPPYNEARLKSSDTWYQ